MRLFSNLCDAALLEETRHRLGLEGLTEFMEWGDKDNFYAERSKLAAGQRRFSQQQRDRLIDMLYEKLTPEEKEHIAIVERLDELLKRTQAPAERGRPAPVKKR